MTRTLSPLLVLSLFLFGCQTIDVTNGATGPVTVTVGDEDPPSNTDEDEPLIDTSQVTKTLDEGETASFTVNVALNVNTTEIRARGEFVDLFEEITLAEEGPTLYIVEDNAGGIVINNVSGETINELWLSRVSTMDDEWVFGFGDWGEPHGPIADGESLQINPLIAADDWALKYDGVVFVSPQHTVSVGVLSQVDIQPR